MIVQCFSVGFVTTLHRIDLIIALRVVKLIRMKILRLVPLRFQESVAELAIDFEYSVPKLIRGVAWFQYRANLLSVSENLSSSLHVDLCS